MMIRRPSEPPTMAEMANCYLAATAAVAVAAATVAATAYSMTSKGKSGSSGGGLAGAGYVGPGLRERLFNRGTQDIMESERAILDDALAQGKELEPEMYKALGLEPVYDRPEDPELSQLSQALAGKQTRLNEIRTERAALQSQRGKGRKGRQKQLRKLTREANRLNKEIPAFQSEVESRGAVGRKVVGFKPLGGVADPTGSAGNAFGATLDQFNLHLADALAGKEPLDPTLKESFNERERVLRERLRRQMGPDYETSTAGSQALANFDRERSEAYAQYNRQSIEGFSRLAESRATSLQALTSGRLKNLAFPATFRSALAGELGDAADRRLRQRELTARERGMKGAATRRQAEERAAESAARQEALGNILSGVASAAGGAGGTMVTGAAAAGEGALLGASVSPEAGAVGPPSQGLAGVGGSIGGGRVQSLLGLS
jgi:hypothetical protein